MDIERNVVLDLLPLYFSDEASVETRKLVEDHLARDPDLARLADQWQLRLPQQPPAPLNPDAETLAYKRAQQLIWNRMLTLAIVVAVGAFALGGAALTGALLMFRF